MCKESIFLYLWGELGVTWSAAGLTVESAPFRNRLIQVRWTGINSNVLAYKSAASICQRSTRCPGGEVWNTAAVFMCACDKETNKEKHFLPFPVSFHVHEIGALQAITSAVNCSFEWTQKLERSSWVCVCSKGVSQTTLTLQYSFAYNFTDIHIICILGWFLHTSWEKKGSDAKYGNMLIHQRPSLQIRKSTLWKSNYEETKFNWSTTTLTPRSDKSVTTSALFIKKWCLWYLCACI